MAIKAKTIIQAAIIGLLLLIIWNLWSRPSPFTLGSSDLTIRGTKAGPASLFDIQPNLECTPGPGPRADYYTRGLTPGGLCGGMDYVHTQQRDYSILGGIGGSVLNN